MTDPKKDAPGGSVFFLRAELFALACAGNIYYSNIGRKENIYSCYKRD